MSAEETDCGLAWGGASDMPCPQVLNPNTQQDGVRRVTQGGGFW